MTVKLHVGYVGVTREGRREKIISYLGWSLYSFLGESGQKYLENGRYYLVDETQYDILGPWVEPVAVKSPIETVTQNNLVEGLYGNVTVFKGSVNAYSVDTQAKLEAAIEILILIRDAKALK